MTLKNTLDRITYLLRQLQHKDKFSKDDFISSLQSLLLFVGQTLVQRDSFSERLTKYNTQLWISHLRGHVACHKCSAPVPLDFFVGSKGLDGRQFTSNTKDRLIELLEFPPIDEDYIKNNPIPDFFPEI